MLIVVAILLCTLAALHPVRLGRVRLDILTVPLLVLLVLFLSGEISADTIRLGVLGTGGLHPWEILVIFFTTAYVSVSVDVSGVLDWLAFKVIRRSRGNGLRLFVFFYLFSCVLTVFTSNDIVILILTPIIFYLGRHAELNVLPLLFAEYFGANTASMLLLIGNPTNVIVGSALRISFAEFTRVMWFPTLTAITATGALLFWRFRKELTRGFAVPESAPFGVRSRWDAAFSSSVLLLMLAFLSVSHRLGVPIWVITAGAALVLVIEDLLFGIYYVGRKIRLPLLLRDEETIHAFEAYGIREHALESWITIKRVPWKIAPFVTVLFILVAGLNKNGLTVLFEHQLAVLGDGTGLPVFVWGGAAALVCNLINNQPMTVLAAEMLMHAPSPGPAYAVVIASNIGANLTILGALAGLMWKRILGTAGLVVSYREFLRHGIRIVPPVLLLSLAALLAVV